ncbi:hypothetical protein CR205_01570 [Alteribacter lacisalsi]|uniref:Uroporphyrinogen-III synthase n=1 Tax=Alteribacter lacisalsi TaxID=2045244 RepID=A0A2W0HUJ0_9BACI|nr:uroporphyrinogen-III synthase [Alteribacter lacisalsi]PYZ97318.1 hypothetical protein CR205_01570 [Alteribacter lacisalsi]
MAGLLEGVTVANTRAAHQAAQFSALIREHGGSTFEAPLIKVFLSEDVREESNVFSRLHSFDAIIFTSTNAVAFTLEALEEAGLSVQDLARVPVACVGTKTEAALTEHGISVSYMPDRFDAENLAAELIRHLSKGSCVLYPRSRMARTVLKDTLTARGIYVEDPVIYDTGPDDQGAMRLKKAVLARQTDVIPFFSPSAVRAFFSHLSMEEREQISRTCLIAAIGPVTEQALRQERVTHYTVARRYTAEGMIEAVADALS